MPKYRYRIPEDQGVCPEGHPCVLLEDAQPGADDPMARVLRQCDTPHLYGATGHPYPYTGAAIVERCDGAPLDA